MALSYGTAEYTRTLDLCRLYLREPSWSDAAQGFTFEPPLTTAEQATFADLQAMAKTPYTAQMTVAEYQAIKPFLASEVAWQAITRNAFVNMTDGDMRRAVYDIITAEVRLARAMRRDS